MENVSSASSSVVLGDLAKLQLMHKVEEHSSENVSKVSLTRLDCSFDTVSHRESLALRDIVRHNYKLHRADVTIMYAIRQPGCPSCREHGLDLSEFVSKDPKLALIGTVKETGKNDLELLKFYQNYFRGNAIYLDQKWNIFKALGSRKLSMTKVVLGYFRSLRRYRSKGVVLGSGPAASEGFVMGGYLVFDRDGDLTFALEAAEFEEVYVEMLAAAVTETRRMYKMKNAQNASSNTSSNTSITSVEAPQIPITSH